jgi:cell division initiation protein
MMTPKEVQEHGFTQARKGYDMAEVDEFLDALTEDYTALFTNYGKLSNSYAKLKKKAQALAAALEQSQNSKPVQTTRTVSVVDTAASQSAADELLRAARKDAEAIRAGAERERQDIIAKATDYAAENAERLKGEVAAEEARLASAKKATAEYISQVKRIIARQSALLDEMPGSTPTLDEEEEEGTVLPAEEAAEEPTIPISSTAALAEEISRQINSLDYSDDLDSDDLDETRIMAAAGEDEDSLFDMISEEGQDADLEGEFDEE